MSGHHYQRAGGGHLACRRGSWLLPALEAARSSFQRLLQFTGKVPPDLPYLQVKRAGLSLTVLWPAPTLFIRDPLTMPVFDMDSSVSLAPVCHLTGWETPATVGGAAHSVFNISD